MPPRPGLSTSLLPLLALAACCSDDTERPPWERPDGAAPAARDGAAPDGAADGGAAFSPVDGRVDLEGSRATVELDGLRVTPGGLVRGWLEADLDADGDADAALLQERPPEEGETARALELLTYRRDGDELVAAGGESLPSPLGGGCSLSALALRGTAPGTVALAATARCPEGAGADAGPSEGPVTRTTAAVGAGPFPLRLRVIAELHGDAAAMTIDAADRDGDGAADAILTLERAGARAEVVWLDRTAGPSLDPGATERSLQAALPPPAGRKALAARLPLVQGIIDLRRLLCSSSLDGTTLSFLTSPGQTPSPRPARLCHTSRAVGSAIALLVRGNVDAGRIPQARAALSLLMMEGIGLGEERRTALERSIAEHSTLAIETTYEPGPAANVTEPRPGGRAPVRFLDDDRIWVEATPPFIYFVSSRTSQPQEPLPAVPGGGIDRAPPPRAPMPEARSGAHRVVGAAEGLWIAEGAAWSLRPAAEVGGPWNEVVSLALSPSGDAVAAVRRGRLEVVRVRRAAAPVPLGGGDGGAGGGAQRRAGDGG